MKHYLSTGWLILLLSACSGSMKDNGNSELLIIPVDVAQNSPVRLSEISDDIKKIELETSDECLIKRIVQVVCNGNRIFVLDAQAGMRIHVFDLSGKFIYAIDRRGQGPGEYIYIQNITADPQNNHIYINPGIKKLIRYDQEGHFIDEFTTIDGLIQYIRFENDLLYVFCEEFGRPIAEGMTANITNMIGYKRDWQPVDTLMVNKVILHGTIGTSVPNLEIMSQDDQNNVFVYCPYFAYEPLVRDTLYVLDKNRLKPYAKLKFSDENSSHKKNINSILRTSNLLIAEFFRISEKEKQYFCYDFRSKTGKTMTGGFLDDVHDTGLAEIRLLNNRYFYFWKEAEDLSPSEEEPNPTLYIGKLKD